MNYVARCPGCKRLVAAVSDQLPAWHSAKQVAIWIERGDIVERMETEAVRQSDWTCMCERPAKTLLASTTEASP